MTTKIRPQSRFEWITRNDVSLRPDYDLAVLQSEFFVVMPSLGALVEGWLLMIPRRRIANFAQLTLAERNDASALVQMIESRIKRPNHSIFRFEHGGHFGSAISCGVEQAHLHIVPLPFDLFAKATSSEVVDWSRTICGDGLPPVSNNDEYLWIRTEDAREASGIPQMQQSQWFRKLIASNVGRPDDWDYKMSPELDRLRRTASELTGRHV